jgi:hypothetical protein
VWGRDLLCTNKQKGMKLSFLPGGFPLDIAALHMRGLAVVKELWPHLIPGDLKTTDTVDNSAAKVPP